MKVHKITLCMINEKTGDEKVLETLVPEFARKGEEWGILKVLINPPVEMPDVKKVEPPKLARTGGEK